MNRSEQIEEAAEGRGCYSAFVEGAEWADANPQEWPTRRHVEEICKLQREQLAQIKACLDVAVEALKFYAGQYEYGGKKWIEWNPHVCDSYSGLQYAPDWDGSLQDEPQDFAVKALAKIAELQKEKE